MKKCRRKVRPVRFDQPEGLDSSNKRQRNEQIKIVDLVIDRTSSMDYSYILYLLRNFSVLSSSLSFISSFNQTLLFIFRIILLSVRLNIFILIN